MASFTPWLKVKFFKENNEPLSNGQVETYLTGTLTPAVTYSDPSENSSNPNPVILDSKGEADVYLSEDLVYRFIVKDELGNTIEDIDPIYPSGTDQDVISDGRFKISSLDNSAGFAQSKIIDGENTTITVTGGPGDDQTLQVDVDFSGYKIDTMEWLGSWDDANNGSGSTPYSTDAIFVLKQGSDVDSAINEVDGLPVTNDSDSTFDGYKINLVGGPTGLERVLFPDIFGQQAQDNVSIGFWIRASQDWIDGQGKIDVNVATLVPDVGYIYSFFEIRSGLVRIWREFDNVAGQTEYQFSISDFVADEWQYVTYSNINSNAPLFNGKTPVNIVTNSFSNTRAVKSPFYIRNSLTIPVEMWGFVTWDGVDVWSTVSTQYPLSAPLPLLSKGDCVSHSGYSWVSLEGSNTDEPSFGSSKWKQFGVLVENGIALAPKLGTDLNPDLDVALDAKKPKYTPVEVSANHTASAFEAILVTATSDVTITLPTASEEVEIVVKKVSGSGRVIIDGPEDVDGQDQQIIQYINTSVTLLGSSTEWFIV